MLFSKYDTYTYTRSKNAGTSIYIPVC